VNSVPRIVLLNPNTDRKVTRMMVEVASETLGTEFELDGRTVPFGSPIVTTPASLADAARHVVRTVKTLKNEAFSAIIISGFGDPGLGELKGMLSIPAVGIAEASMAEAAYGGRRFSIVTTTPHLKSSIEDTAARYGHAALLASVRITPGDAEETMADPLFLQCALLDACRIAHEKDGAEAIVIGGGPLAISARAIAAEVPVPLIEPVEAGARLAVSRIRSCNQRS